MNGLTLEHAGAAGAIIIAIMMLLERVGGIVRAARGRNGHDASRAELTLLLTDVVSKATASREQSCREYTATTTRAIEQLCVRLKELFELQAERQAELAEQQCERQERHEAALRELTTELRAVLRTPVAAPPPVSSPRRARGG